jgi:hypothetical protein
MKKAKDACGAGPKGVEQRRQMIATAAYLRAERRGFASGDAVTDWLEAEAEVDAETARRAGLAAHEGLLAIASQKIAALEATFVGLKADARRRVARDIAKLAGLKDELESVVDGLRQHGDHMEKEAKQRVQRAREKLSRALDRVSAQGTERDR